MRLSAVLISVCFLTLISSRLEASSIIFTDRAVFEAVVQPNALVTFDKVVSIDEAIGFDISSDVMFFLFVGANGVFELIPFTPEFSRFVGLSFSTPASSVSLAYIPLRGFSPGIVDNMLIRTVPEPSTILLFGSALALVQGVRHRRRIAVFKDRL